MDRVRSGGLPTRILTTAPFAEFAKKARIADAALIEAIGRVERGLVDADLGGGVLKLKVARSGEGRRDGYRTIVACVVGARAFFLYGYAKSELENIGASALEGFRAVATDLQSLSDARLTRLIEAGDLREIER